MDFAGYMRVSRKGDRDPDKWLTIPTQERAIRGGSGIKRIDGARLVEPLEQDIDVSGMVEYQPTLEKVVERIERGELGGLVVAKVDRFSRDLPYGAMVARRVERAGGTFVAADDGIVLSPSGRSFGGDEAAYFQFVSLLNMADFFGRRVKRVWHETIDRHVLEQGRHWGYQVPFGYQKAEDGRLVPDPVFSRLLVEAFERRAEGEGCSAIAAWLDTAGARTAREGRPTHRWVKDILANRVYLGEARAGERVLAGAHEALVDEGLFAAAAAQLGRPKTRRVPLAEDAAPVLSGLVRCWGCRTVMTGGFRTGRRRVYRCRRIHSGGTCIAPADALEDELLDLVEPLFWKVLGAELQARGVDDDSGEGDRLEAAAGRARRGLEVYRDAIGMAELDAEVAAAGLRKHQERVRAAQAELDDWRRHRTRERVNVRQLKRGWKTYPPAVRGRLLGDVIGAIVVRRPPIVKRGQTSPALGRTAVLLVDGLPEDLPRQGGRAAEIRPFVPFDDEALPWVHLGE